MDLQERVQVYLKHKGINAKTFEINTGLGNGTCAKLSGSIRKSTCDRISKAYPDLNIDWLLTGEGEMLKPPAANVVENTNNSGSITQTTTTAAPSPSSAALDRALSEIAEQRKLVADSHALTAASQAQVDRLLAIIENMTSRK